MKEKIETLIAENKLLKDQCWAEINELRESKFNRSLKTGMKIAKLETEYEMRNEFIKQLDDLLEQKWFSAKEFFNENQDKF